MRCLDGEQNILQLGIGLVDIVHVIGGHIFGFVARAECQQVFVQFGNLFDVVMLEFYKETICPKNIVVPIHAPHSFFGIFFDQGTWDLSGHASTGADQSLGVGGQEVMVDARVVVEAFQLGRRGDLEQVLVPGHVLGQQQQVIG